jgi:hypothetical protein
LVSLPVRMVIIIDCSADLQHSHLRFADLYAAARGQIWIGDFECDTSNDSWSINCADWLLFGQSFVRGIMTIPREGFPL